MKKVSCRRSALRAGDRAGMLAGMLARGQTPRMSRDYARRLAHTDAGIPSRWQPIYTKSFIKAAISAAHVHVDPYVAKYGVA